MTIDAPQPSAIQTCKPGFLKAADWWSFGITTVLALTVYLLTLAPEVSLGYSGIFCSAAMYPSGSIPSGHPLWALYGWVFIKLIPSSNIAWRLGVASAVAGALACGLVALVVSRVGLRLAQSVTGSKRLSSSEQAFCRVTCGVVAGLALAFDGGLWCKAVVADSWPLSVLLFALTIWLAAEWFFEPERRGYLYAAASVHGLNLCESQAFVPATFALPLLLAFGERELGRQALLCMGLCLWSVLLMKDSLSGFGWRIETISRNLIVGGAITVTVGWLSLSLFTRRFFGECKTTTACAVLFVAGLSFNFLLPLFSMTNPPVNWGYPRTVEGFFHVLSRGQFPSLLPVGDISQLMMQWGIYCKSALVDFGYPCLAAAALPLLFLKQVSGLARRWLVGLLLMWFTMTLLMLIALNVPEYGVEKAVSPFFVPTRLLLATLAGLGLLLVAGNVGARRDTSKM